MRLIKFRTEEGVVRAIAGDPGRIYTQLVWIDAPIRLRKVTNQEVDRYGVDHTWKPTTRKAARTMLQVGKRLGITKGAKKFLQAAARGE